MNNPSPLVPQGSFADQKNKGRAKVKIAVFFVLAVHGIGLMALLMQGCRRDDSNAFTDPGTNDLATTTTTTLTEPTQPVFEPTNPPMADSNMLTSAEVPSNAVPTTTTGLPVGTEPPPPLPTDATTGAGAPPSGTVPMTEYKVVKGDSFTTIANKFHTSVKAIQAANPGVDSSKLQIGQPLQIPPPSPATTSTPAPVAGSQQTYKVVSGDNLTKIAQKFGTTVKALRNANGLKTDSIKVGQTLKIPVKTPATAPTFDSTAPAPAPGQ